MVATLLALLPFFVIVACSPPPATVTLDDCARPEVSVLRASAMPVTVLSPPDSRLAGALGRAHNEGVREIFRRAGRIDPDPKDLSELADAVLAGARSYAAYAGFDPAEVELTIKKEAVRVLERDGVLPEGRALAARWRSEPQVERALQRDSVFRQQLAERVVKRRKARGAASLISELLSDSIRFLDAGAEITDAVTDSTIDASAVAAATTVAATFWKGTITDTIYQQAVDAVEEIADSSRFLWEEVALDAWITSGGTYSPQNLRGIASVIANGCREGARPAPEQPQNVIACPWCLAAAAGAAGTDVVTAISNYDNKVAHPIGSVVAASAAGAVFAAAAVPGTVSAGVARLTGWVSRLFGP